MPQDDGGATGQTDAGPGGALDGGDGAGGGGGMQGFTCPEGSFGAPVPADAEPTRVDGVPPLDDFNNGGAMYTIVEGPVWWRGALYVSEVKGEGPVPPPSRILEITADGVVSIALEDTGSNGLAIDPEGELVAARHSDGSIARIDLLGDVTPIAEAFGGSRFNCPNDLAYGRDGNLYFSDPSWQAPTPRPQEKTRLYRVDPEGQVTAVDDTLDQPNGVTLSPDGETLYVSGNQLERYPVHADGSLGEPSAFVPGSGGDGMVVDCAGNLYVTREDGVVVYSAEGERLTEIVVPDTTTTNVAFGGDDHRTLFITGMGSGGGQGLFRVDLNVPGFPY